MARLNERLTEFQRRAVVALADGELCAEAAAQQCGYDVPATAIQSARSPAVWWGRVASGVPPGLINVRWCMKDRKHYYRLTSIGHECAQGLVHDR